jgi:NAD+ diphosphatase
MAARIGAPALVRKGGTWHRGPMRFRPNFCLVCGQPLADHRDPIEPEKVRRRCAADGCGYTFYDNPTPVVAAVVEHEGEIILVRNVGWPENWFGLVTGFLERGEVPADAVLRELSEELGLSGEIVRFIGVYGFPEMNQVILAWHVRASGTVTLGAELAAFKRVPVDELRPWRMGTGRAVADFLAAR